MIRCPLISVFAAFIPALILPEPAFVAVVRSSMTHGTRAGLLTTLVGMLFGIPAARIKGLYLAIATFAAQFIL